MKKSAKLFIFISALAFLIANLFVVKPVFAQTPSPPTSLQCNWISGKVQDEKKNPINGAVITFTLNGETDTMHPVETREDGTFAYSTPNEKQIIFIQVAKNGYIPFSGYLSDCTNNTIILSSSAIPTLPPGSTLRCRGSCAGPDQCSGATDGCTVCYSGTCINPNYLPTPAPEGNVNPKLCHDNPRCMECFIKGNVWTAFGCIPTDTLNNFVAWFLGKLIFVASGIAFLLMAFGALQILTSAGSPEKVQAGKELITSALAGLIFIILSLFLLKLIGVDILQIPGFGK